MSEERKSVGQAAFLAAQAVKDMAKEMPHLETEQRNELLAKAKELEEKAEKLFEKEVTDNEV